MSILNCVRPAVKPTADTYPDEAPELEPSCYHDAEDEAWWAAETARREHEADLDPADPFRWACDNLDPTVTLEDCEQQALAEMGIRS